MQRLSSFSDLAEHYAGLTSAETFGHAFTADIATSQLSHHEEPTSADMPDSDMARGCVEQMVGDLFSLFADTRLAPLAGRVAWGMVNSFHKVAQQIAREEDSAARELGELARLNDPSEIHALELEEKRRHCQSLHEALAALECMRDHAAEVYRVETGKPWSAVYGSRTSRTLIASQIEARDFLAARSAARREAHNPTGPVVVVSGGAAWQHHEPLWARLDRIRERVPSMTLVTTAQRSGTDAIAAAWAAARGVPTVTSGSIAASATAQASSATRCSFASRRSKRSFARAADCRSILPTVAARLAYPLRSCATGIPGPIKRGPLDEYKGADRKIGQRLCAVSAEQLALSLSWFEAPADIVVSCKTRAARHA